MTKKKFNIYLGGRPCTTADSWKWNNYGYLE